MARTAPVPNIPPIPGMCPSIAVLAGGGDGGGGSGNGAGNGNGNGPGGGNGSGDGAGGDGRGANCGGGGGDGGGCPNHHGSSTSSGSSAQGDPVDFATGRVFTTPFDDVVLGGAFPLRFSRSYSTDARKVDLGFGLGFSHTFGWSIEEGRDSMLVRTPEGTVVELPRAVPGEAVLGPHGWLIHREPSGLALDLPNNQRFLFEPIGDAGRYVVTALADRHDNRFTLHYVCGALARIVDPVGREVRFPSGADGHAAAIEVSHPTHPSGFLVVASFVYDEHDRLVSSRDAEGFETSFTYDEQHRLTAMQRPGGTVFRYVYDAEGRCVETWGEGVDGAPDPSLDPDTPAVLADAATTARGVLHVKLQFGPGEHREAIDSVNVQRGVVNEHGKFDKLVSGGRVYTRTFDDRGFLTSFTDPLGATTRWERDLRGREIRIQNALGNTTRIDREPNGDIRRVIDPAGGLTEVHQTARGFSFRDPIDRLFQVEVDRRGLTTATIGPDGTRTTFVYDCHANLIEKRDPRGVHTYGYDGWGRCTRSTDPMGSTRSFTWSDRGHLVGIQEEDGSRRQYSYDRDGNLASVVDARGRTEMQYGLAGRLHFVLGPTGDETRFYYDREGRMTRIRNAAGEEHRFERRSDGQVTTERTFDGRTISYRYDLLGRVVQKGERGERVTFERDLLGRVCKREHADGASEMFVYDTRGDIVAATTPDTQLTFQRNPIGWIVRETQVVDGEPMEVAVDYDDMARLARLTTSFGHSLHVERDPKGEFLDVLLDREERVRVRVDALDREIARELPGGGRIDTRYDPLGRLSGRRVFMPGATAAGEPDWVGDSPRGVTVDQRFQFVGDELVSAWDGAGGSTEYTYDPLGRLLRAVPSRLQAQLFRYDAGGRPHDAAQGAPGRSYGPGGTLERNGAIEYVYDDAKRLTAAIERTPDGRTSTTKHSYRAGRLATTELPDGRRIEYAYDAFGRRLKKQVLALRDGKAALQSVTRFVWEATTIIHEEKTFVGADGASVVEDKTFCYGPGGVEPWAQRSGVRRGDGREAGPWLHMIVDPTGAPERLVDRTGRVTSAWRREAWGAASGTPPTPLRVLGQYADEETGLHYNWHRYYDPRTGRYTTPDPLGIDAGLDPFAYANNAPTSFVDPYGLMFTIIRCARTGRVLHSGENLAAGGGTTDINPALPGARASCSETAALNGMANSMTGTPEQRRAEIARRFNEGEVTMETFEGNREDFEKSTARQNDARRQNPCPQCSAMLQSMGIQNGVVGVNPRNGKPGNWRPTWPMIPGRGRR
ncbi:MAG: RHS repeat-associated core domain-containing protein [Polyangiaceae bacterium]|nr:RHS repeat-associated core domain-containing protein [Polyangiaceae bacterium]